MYLVEAARQVLPIVPKSRAAHGATESCPLYNLARLPLTSRKGIPLREIRHFSGPFGLLDTRLKLTALKLCGREVIDGYN
jgi:hypothetical protein